MNNRITQVARRLLATLVVCLGVADVFSAPPPHARMTTALEKVIERRMAEGDGQPVTVILESLTGDDLGPVLKTKKFKARFKMRSRHEFSLPPAQISLLLKQLPASVIARQSYPFAPTVVGQGVALTGAADFQQLGTDGSGVKVGVIDLQFSNYTTSQANGELPANLVITDYTGMGLGGGNHGTNVAEIVHDMAPGADLYLARVGSDVQLEQAMLDMVGAGVQVIVHSVAWFGAAFYDGTGPLCDITQAAESNGILWMNAAGNSRNQHYLATFSDADTDDRHEFAAGQNYNTVTANAGSNIRIVLNWDAYPITNVDYDLYLYDGDPTQAGSTAVDSSTYSQRFGDGADPYESINYSVPVNGTYYVVVQRKKRATALPFAIFSLSHNLTVKTIASSIVQPADCASTVAIAATDLSDTPEWFSSEGPRWDGFAKPDIAAPDRVQTSLSGSFAGTSAAAPHAGGAAALLFQADPLASVGSVRQALIDSARDVHTAGFDNRTGYGRISLDADGDGWNADLDNCPLISNLDQQDLDSDGVGDVCDNCVQNANPDQQDLDTDGIGDVCDICPTVANDDIADPDLDGLGNFAECVAGTDPALWDTDGDGLRDGDEVNLWFTDPLEVDTDLDGFDDYVETQLGTDPNLATEFPATSNGDVNGDGLLDARDILLAQQALLGGIVLDLGQGLRCDVAPLIDGSPSPDGALTAGDLVLIQRLVFGDLVL